MRNTIYKIILICFFISALIGLESIAAASSPEEVAEGYYTISSALNSNCYLDVNGAGIANGTNIQIWERNGTEAQLYTITKIQGSWYSIRNYVSGKAIDVTGGVAGNEVNVQLYEYNGTDAQLWQFIDAGNGYFYVKNKLGYYLDVWNNRTGNGTNVQTYSLNCGSNQRWKLTRILRPGVYTFTSGLSSSKRLDVNGGSNDNGTNIQLWTSNGTDAQTFYITTKDGVWYSILNISSRKAIDVNGGVAGNEVNVQLYEENGTDAQLWQFIDAGNGYFYLKNKLGYYLDVWGGQTQDGTNIQTYSLNRGNNQKWKVELKDCTESLLSDILVNLYEDASVYEYFGTNIDKLIFYYQNFNHRAKYDIKNPDRWTEFFTKIPYVDFEAGYLFDHMILTPEQLGNLVYGLSGRYLGISNRTIFQGGGYAAQGTRYLNDPSNYYGDSKDDHAYIEIGTKYVSKSSSLDIDISQYSAILKMRIKD